MRDAAERRRIDYGADVGEDRRNAPIPMPRVINLDGIAAKPRSTIPHPAETSSAPSLNHTIHRL